MSKKYFHFFSIFHKPYEKPQTILIRKHEENVQKT